MGTLHLMSPSLESTIQIGRILGKSLRNGSFVALDGILGAGKTQFVKGIACGLDEGGWAGLRSPTFTLMLSYHGGRCVLHHVDFYRLNESPELPGEILEAIESERAITVVEWADIWRDVWPEKHVHVSFEIEDDTNKRRICIEDPTSICPNLATELDDYVFEPAETCTSFAMPETDDNAKVLLRHYERASWPIRILALVLFTSPVWLNWLLWNLPQQLHLYWQRIPLTIGLLFLYGLLVWLYRRSGRLGRLLVAAPANSELIRDERRIRVRSYPLLIFGAAGLASLLSVVLLAPWSPGLATMSGIMDDIWIPQEERNLAEVATRMRMATTKGQLRLQSGPLDETPFAADPQKYGDILLYRPEDYELVVAGDAPAYAGTKIIAHGRWWYDGTSPRAQHDVTLTVRNLEKGEWRTEVTLTPPPFLADE